MRSRGFTLVEILVVVVIMAVIISLAVLSMGMSGDFEAAILCGATHVRIGSAIFGAR